MVDGEPGAPAFRPAPDLAAWMMATFIADGAPLQNDDHQHLQEGNIGVLWTTVDNARGGRAIIGQAELGKPAGAMGKWARARAEQQVLEWFGEVPDFVITIFAPYAETCSDAQFMALCEHELSHCGQECNKYGQPKFSRSTGLPVFALRAHDVEEFIGVVRRYGADAAGVRALIDAAEAGPTIAAAEIDFACGNCAR